MLNQIKFFDVNKKKVRCGPKSDGGYVLLNEISKNTNTLFSFGVENNIDFELEFIKKIQTKANHSFLIILLTDFQKEFKKYEIY